MEEKSVKKEYIPHKIRSRPFRCITLPAICILIFIAYWLMFCPLVYVVVWNDYNNYYKHWDKWWPFAFWGVAFIIFVVIMLVMVLIWRCMKQKEREEANSGKKTEYDALLRRKNTGVKELYHVSLSTEKSKELMNVSLETMNREVGKKSENGPEVGKKSENGPEVGKKSENRSEVGRFDCEVVNSESGNKPEDSNRDTIISDFNIRLSSFEPKNTTEDMPKFPKCSIKRRPDLNLNQARPLSEISTTSLPRSPLSPRELFFIDLIQAANTSPASFIPPTESFLENERKYYVPEGISALSSNTKPVLKICWLKSGSDFSAENSPDIFKEKKDSDSEFFIANVGNDKTVVNEAFIFVDGGEPAKNLKVTVFENSDDVFVD